MTESTLSEEATQRIVRVTAFVVCAATIGIGVWADRAYRRWLRSINPFEDVRHGVARGRVRLREQRESAAEAWELIRALVG